MNGLSAVVNDVRSVDIISTDDGTVQFSLSTIGDDVTGMPLRRSVAFLRGKQTAQSERVQFFQCVMICLDDAQ